MKPAHWGRGVEAPHVRLTSLERDERPVKAMDFAARKAQADDGRADDDLGTFLAIVDSSTSCLRTMASETIGATDHLASSVADFVKNLFVVRLRLRSDNEASIMAVAEKMPDRVVVDTSPRHSSASNGLAERSIWTVGEQPRTLRYDTQNRYKTRITLDSVIWPWIVRWILCREMRTWSGLASHRSGQRMTEITRKRLFRLWRLSCQNIVDCHQERDSLRRHCVGQGSGLVSQRQTLEHVVGTKSENNPKVGTDETFRNFIVVRDAGSALGLGTQRTAS